MIDNLITYYKCDLCCTNNKCIFYKTAKNSLRRRAMILESL